MGVLHTEQHLLNLLNSGMGFIAPRLPCGNACLDFLAVFWLTILLYLQAFGNDDNPFASFFGGSGGFGGPSFGGNSFGGNVSD